MPIYSKDVDPWVPLHSSIGSGPRGNGLYVSSIIYTTTNTDIYLVGIESLKGPDVEDAHDGDLVAFKSKFGDMTFYHIGVVTSRSSATLTVRSVIRSDEWSVDQAQMKRDWNSLKTLVNTAIRNAESATNDMNDLIDEIRETLENGGFKGDKGDRGDAFVFEDFTDAQLLDLRQDVSSIYYRKVLNVYTTSQNDTTGNPAIALDAGEFNSSMMLFVFVNGLLCGTNEYTVLAEGTVVRFNHAFSVVGTKIEFIGVKAIAITAEDYDALKGDPAPASEVSAAVAAYLQSHPELVFVGATSSADGRDGLVPGPTTWARNATLFGDGSWSRIDITNDPTVTTGYSISLDKVSESDTETLGSLVIPIATSSVIGMMSAEDKAKLDGIGTGANQTNLMLRISDGITWAEITKVFPNGGNFSLPFANLDNSHHVRVENLPEIPEEKIADNAVTSAKLASSSVTNEKLASNSVTTAKITDGSVTTSKLANVSVTTEKLANSSVTAFKIRDGVITDDKLIQSGGVLSRVSALEDKTRLVTQATNGLMSAADKTKLDNMGDGTIPAGSITTTKLADSAVVTQKIADNAVTTDKLADDVVDSIKSDIQSGIQTDIQPIIDAAQGAADDALAAAAEAWAASAATWLSGNVLFGELAESTVLTTDDAYAAPPKGVEVYGVSTQDGTPTPDAPVEIASVDECVLNIMGKNWLDVNAPRKTNTSVAKDGSGVWYPYAVSNYLNNFGGNSLSIDGDTITFTSKSNYGFGVEAHVLPDATYTISAQSITVSDGAAYDIRINYVRKDGTFTYLTLGTNVNRVTTTIPSYAIYAIFTISVSANVVSTITVKGLQLELGSTATDYEPYVGTSTAIPLIDHTARSLPDGTRDTLTLSYIGPSTREGWGVYSKTLVQHVGEIADLSTLDWRYNESYTCFTTNLTQAKVEFSALCSAYRYVGSYRDLAEKTCSYIYNTYLAIRDTDYENATAFKASISGVKVIYALATPVTHDLGTIELPLLPNPLTAWADGGSAQPTMQLEYERALSIVIPRIEAAISDLATS